MQKIKIFLASSNELKADRDQFEILIRRKNDEWIAEGKPYLDLQIWEEASDAMSATRSQDEYNKIIQEVDIFVMLFWTKVGKYTHEEFSLAKKLFLETGKPRVLVYQKAANPENQEQSLKDFIASLLANDKEYFWGNYEHFDTLALKFDKELRMFYSKIQADEKAKIREKANRSYKLANLNKLLMNGYSDEDLTAFCQFNFEKVFNNFTNGQSKQQKVMALIDYCKKFVETDTLLELLQAENEKQFQQYAPYF
jgi:ribosome-binding ATPase YchF (GTP1/OBG family)